uniref:Uncharacterized protein n=1 Tax=Siphoviridae sp. ctiV651 TaxID=2827917 RepID=A0A8S5S5L1_9CAUD|nr:MAG TPA: hypothetical protein [Siphoviridae sp. ctiV651]
MNPFIITSKNFTIISLFFTKIGEQYYHSNFIRFDTYKACL